MNTNTNMTEGPYLRKIIGLALPLMLGSVFQQLYSVVDTAIAGRFVGVEALAALGSADWFLWMVLGIIVGMTEAVSILMAQRFGARDREGMAKTLSTAIVLTAVLAGIVLVLVQCIVDIYLRLVRVPENVMGMASSYLRIYFAGVPIVATYNLCSAVLRGLGNGRSPLVAMVIASIMNIVLDLLFVVGFGWGVPGCAVATVLAQLCSALYCFMAVRRSVDLGITLKDVKADRKTLGSLLKLGSPMALQNVIISLGGIAVQYIINGFGYLFLASYTATNKLYGILEMAAISYGTASASFVGQNLGARRMDRVRHGTHTAVLLSAVTSLVITAIMMLFGRNIIGLFVDATTENAAEVIDVAFLYLKIMALPLSILYLLHTYRSALQGLGNTLIPMISGMAELTMRITSAYVFSRFIGSTAVFIAEPLAWAGADMILIISYYVVLRRRTRQVEAQAE